MSNNSDTERSDLPKSGTENSEDYAVDARNIGDTTVPGTLGQSGPALRDMEPITFVPGADDKTVVIAESPKCGDKLEYTSGFTSEMNTASSEKQLNQTQDKTKVSFGNMETSDKESHPGNEAVPPQAGVTTDPSNVHRPADVAELLKTDDQELGNKDSIKTGFNDQKKENKSSNDGQNVLSLSKDVSHVQKITSDTRDSVPSATGYSSEDIPGQLEDKRSDDQQKTLIKVDSVTPLEADDDNILQSLSREPKTCQLSSDSVARAVPDGATVVEQEQLLGVSDETSSQSNKGSTELFTTDQKQPATLLESAYFPLLESESSSDPLTTENKKDQGQMGQPEESPSLTLDDTMQTEPLSDEAVNEKPRLQQSSTMDSTSCQIPKDVSHESIKVNIRNEEQHKSVKNDNRLSPVLNGEAVPQSRETESSEELSQLSDTLPSSHPCSSGGETVQEYKDISLPSLSSPTSELSSHIIYDTMPPIQFECEAVRASKESETRTNHHQPLDTEPVPSSAGCEENGFLEPEETNQDKTSVPLDSEPHLSEVTRINEHGIPILSKDKTSRQQQIQEAIDGHQQRTESTDQQEMLVRQTPAPYVEFVSETEYIQPNSTALPLPEEVTLSQPKETDTKEVPQQHPPNVLSEGEFIKESKEQETLITPDLTDVSLRRVDAVSIRTRTEDEADAQVTEGTLEAVSDEVKSDLTPSKMRSLINKLYAENEEYGQVMGLIKILQKACDILDGKQRRLLTGGYLDGTVLTSLRTGTVELDMMLDVVEGREDIGELSQVPGHPSFCMLDMTSHITKLIEEEEDEDLEEMGISEICSNMDPSGDFLKVTYKDSDQAKVFMTLKGAVAKSKEDFKNVYPNSYKAEKDVIIHDLSDSISALWPKYGGFGKQKLILCLRHNGWPAIAEEFFTRPRKWPTESVMEDIKQGGFHLVPECPEYLPEHDPEITMRYSFAYAENKLAEAMSTAQRRCLGLLKLVNHGPMVRSGTQRIRLTSYHLKTILYWSCEKNHLMWENQHLGECFLSLINDAIRCLDQGQLQMFFISETNLLQGFSVDELQGCKQHFIEFLSSMSNDSSSGLLDIKSKIQDLKNQMAVQPQEFSRVLGFLLKKLFPSIADDAAFVEAWNNRENPDPFFYMFRQLINLKTRLELEKEGLEDDDDVTEPGADMPGDFRLDTNTIQKMKARLGNETNFHQKLHACLRETLKETESRYFIQFGTFVIFAASHFSF